MRYICQHPHLTYLTYIPPEDILPRCRRCRFGDTAASGAGTNGFRAKGTGNQRFARTAKARIGIGRDNRRCPLLTSDVENDLDCPRTFSSVVHKQSALVAIGGRARQVSNLRHWDYRTPLYPLSYERTGLLALAFDVRPVLRAPAGRPRPPLPSGRFRRRLQTFSNGISIPAKQNAAFLPRVGSNLQQDILPT